jgi:hypothetical protein
MSFTVLSALFLVFVLAAIFGVIYKRNGLKTALITTGVSLVIFSVLYVAIVMVIVNAMD